MPCSRLSDSGSSRHLQGQACACACACAPRGSPCLHNLKIRGRPWSQLAQHIFLHDKVGHLVNLFSAQVCSQLAQSHTQTCCCNSGAARFSSVRLRWQVHPNTQRYPVMTWTAGASNSHWVFTAPGTLMRAVYWKSCLLLTGILEGRRCCNAHFTAEDTSTEKG